MRAAPPYPPLGDLLCPWSPAPLADLRPPGSKQQAARDKHVSQRSLRSRYKLQERTFLLRIPTDSILVGKTLAESRIGASTGLIILSLERDGRSETLPGRQTVIRAGDGLLVQGRVDQFRELRRWSDLVIEREAPVLKSMVAAKVMYAAVTVAENSRKLASF